MASNITNQSRNVLNKKFMVIKEVSIHYLTLVMFLYTSIIFDRKIKHLTWTGSSGQYQSLLGYHNHLFYLLDPFCCEYNHISTLEGFKLTPDYLNSAASQGVNVRELCVRSVLAGFCFHP